ncbi:hypothetical protein AC20117_08720 [Arthrobacter crystallopoietes]|nr:hypothetical protein AC20117_08720 [Arthrobacter crystallopoietes]
MKLLTRLNAQSGEQKEGLDMNNLLGRWVQELEFDVNGIYSALLQEALISLLSRVWSLGPLRGGGCALPRQSSTAQ